MSKKVDWSGKGIFNGVESAGPLKKKFLELAAREESMQKSNQELQTMRPQLKQVLTWYMTNQKPFEVIRPFAYQTEKFVKSQSGSGTFHNVNTVMKPGTVLKFVKLEKSTSQFLFEDQNGEEVTIYTSDVIVGGRHGMTTTPNDGLTGLLYNTEIYETLLKLNNNKENQ